MVAHDCSWCAVPAVPWQFGVGSPGPVRTPAGPEERRIESAKRTHRDFRKRFEVPDLYPFSPRETKPPRCLLADAHRRCPGCDTVCPCRSRGRCHVPASPKAPRRGGDRRGVSVTRLVTEILHASASFLYLLKATIRSPCFTFRTRTVTVKHRRGSRPIRNLMTLRCPGDGNTPGRLEDRSGHFSLFWQFCRAICKTPVCPSRDSLPRALGAARVNIGRPSRDDGGYRPNHPPGTEPALTSSHQDTPRCHWFSRFPSALDLRSALGLAWLLVGTVPARGRRTVTPWIRAVLTCHRYKPFLHARPSPRLASGPSLLRSPVQLVVRHR
jgi:hypothetical protein